MGQPPLLVLEALEDAELDATELDATELDVTEDPEDEATAFEDALCPAPPAPPAPVVAPPAPVVAPPLPAAAPPPLPPAVLLVLAVMGSPPRPGAPVPLAHPPARSAPTGRTPR
jgi:hypothetical protein